MTALRWEHLGDLHGGVRGQGGGWIVQVQAHVTQNLVISVNLER